MPRELFGAGSSHDARLGARQWYTVPLSMLTHGAIIAVVIAVPVLATNALPTPGAVLAFVTPPAAPAAPPPVATAVVRPRVEEVELNPALAPTTAPSVTTPEPAPQLAALVGGIQPPSAADRLGVSSLLAPPPAVVAPQQPQRVGGNIMEPRKVHDVTPVYPAVALAARIEGAVILEATIAKDGSVKEVHVLRSIGLLDQAAVDAVRQWRYTAPTLNGQPIDVVMTVTVRFGLNR